MDVQVEFDCWSNTDDGDIKVEFFGDGQSHAATKEKVQYKLRLAGHIAMSGQAGPMGDKIDIAISGFTTKEQRQALFETLAKEGSDALVKAIQDSDDLGWVKTPRGRHTLRYVYKFEQDGKTLIIAATDRPMGYGEVMRSDRSVDYNVSMLSLYVRAAIW